MTRKGIAVMILSQPQAQMGALGAALQDAARKAAK